MRIIKQSDTTRPEMDTLDPECPAELSVPEAGKLAIEIGEKQWVIIRVSEWGTVEILRNVDTPVLYEEYQLRLPPDPVTYVCEYCGSERLESPISLVSCKKCNFHPVMVRKEVP